jgi:hypothetical protein
MNSFNLKLRSKIECCECHVSHHVFLRYDLDAVFKVSAGALMNMHGHDTAGGGHKRQYKDACLRHDKTLLVTVVDTHTHARTICGCSLVAGDNMSCAADLDIISSYKEPLFYAE